MTTEDRKHPMSDADLQALLADLDAKHDILAKALGGAKATVYSRAAAAIRALMKERGE